MLLAGAQATGRRRRLGTLVVWPCQGSCSGAIFFYYLLCDAFAFPSLHNQTSLIRDDTKITYVLFSHFVLRR